MDSKVQLVGPDEPQGIQVGHYAHPDDLEVFFGKDKETEEIFTSIYIPSTDRRRYQGKDNIYAWYKLMTGLEGMTAVQPLDKDIVEQLMIKEFDNKLAKAEEDE